MSTDKKCHYVTYIFYKDSAFTLRLMDKKGVMKFLQDQSTFSSLAKKEVLKNERKMYMKQTSFTAP